MNKVFLQLWEESNKKEGFLSDGCSLHLSLDERNKYVSDVYSKRDTSLVPDEYDRTVGSESVVYVTDTIFEMIKKDKSVKISETAFQNLIKFEDIIINSSEI
jgi:hypothetical protein